MSMVVEATLEEHISTIREVIKGLCSRIEELESQTMQGHHLRKRNKEKELL